MQGNFEINNSAYPIGYLINGGATAEGPTYNVVDMRTLKYICTSTLTAKQIQKVVAALNQNMRDGQYNGEKGDEALAADARGYVEIIEAQGDFAPVLEVPTLEVPESTEPVTTEVQEVQEVAEVAVNKLEQSVLATLPTLPVIGG